MYVCTEIYWIKSNTEQDSTEEKKGIMQQLSTIHSDLTWRLYTVYILSVSISRSYASLGGLSPELSFTASI